MLNNTGDVAQPSLSPLLGIHSELFPSLPLTQYSVPSWIPLRTLLIFSFIPHISSICQSIILFTLGYAFVMSVRTATGSSISCLSLPKLTLFLLILSISSFILIKICAASAVDLPLLNPCWCSSNILSFLSSPLIYWQVL